MIKLTKPERRHGQVELGLNDAVTWWESKRPGMAVRDELEGSSADWRGGTPKQLIDACKGKIDMRPYLNALEKLQPTMKRFTADFSGQMIKRRRTFSEHDGEYDHDRRVSDTPFQLCVRKPVPLKIIRLDVNMCVSGGVSAKDMDNYGATVWAVAQILERMGRKVEVTWIARNGDDNYQSRYTVRIPLKKANQYLAPSLLAATLTTNFYRRMGFALCYYACEGNGLKAPSGLGPTYFTDPISYKDGVMTFCPAQAYHFGGARLQEELSKVLTNAA